MIRGHLALYRAAWLVLYDDWEVLEQCWVTLDCVDNVRDQASEADLIEDAHVSDDDLERDAHVLGALRLINKDHTEVYSEDLLVRCLQAVRIVMINEWHLSIRALLNYEAIRYGVVTDFCRVIFGLDTRVLQDILV